MGDLIVPIRVRVEVFQIDVFLIDGFALIFSVVFFVGDGDSGGVSAVEDDLSVCRELFQSFNKVFNGGIVEVDGFVFVLHG